MGTKSFAAASVISLLFITNGISYSSQLIDEGVALYRNENFEEALEVFKRVDSSEPSATNSYYLGLSLKNTGNRKDSLECFKAALSSNPPENRAAVELISIYISSGEYAEALKLIEWSEHERVSPAEVSFLKGEMLLKRGENEAAISSFTLAKNSDPSLSQQSDLQIAEARVRLNDFKGASEALRALISINPDNEISGFAREYEQRVSAAAARKPWRYFMGINYQYDDNAVVKPDRDIPGVQFPRRGDSSSSQNLRVLYDNLFSSGLTLSGQYTFYNNTYFHLDEYSQMSHTISLSPGYSNDYSAFTIPLTYNYSFLDYDRYSYQATVRPSAAFFLSPKQIAQFSIGFSKREYFSEQLIADENRGADIYSSSIGYLYLPGGGKGLFNLKYELSYEDTVGKNWRALGNKVSADFMAPLYDKTNFILTCELSRLNYPLHSFYGIKRNDTVFAGSATVTHEIFRQLFFNLQYFYTYGDSNIALYKYQRNLYSAGVEFRF